MLTVVAFILVAAAYVPGTRIKAALGHPMTAGVGLWALAHLLSNGTLRAVVLFGAFLAWAVVLFATRRRRDRQAGASPPAGRLARDALVVVVGIVASVGFAIWLHAPLIGCAPSADARSARPRWPPSCAAPSAQGIMSPRRRLPSRPAAFVSSRARTVRRHPAMNAVAPIAHLARDVARRRTFAIISHPDAGKTTLTEKLLLFGGAIQLAGTVKARKSARHATSDWMEIEKQRGISVTSSVMQFDYAGHTINLLDTPGHQDFSEDTYRVLTAVDAAVMVIDAAKGVEAQTIKLLEVCRLRDTPIITFINKMDREVREPLELLDEIESVLEDRLRAGDLADRHGQALSRRVSTCCTTRCCASRRARSACSDDSRADRRASTIRGSTQLLPDEIAALRHDVELIRGASAPFDLRRVPRRHARRRCSSARRSTTSACRRSCTRSSTGRRRRSRATAARASCSPTEPPFTGFVFKIQANMDPQHRDRIAFFRVCSGRFTPGMKVRHLRIGREMKLANALTFMANERVASEDAVAGDIIGIHNHGQLQIGDTLTEGEALALQGHSVLRARALPRRAPARPDQGEAAAQGPAAAGRGGRDPGVRDRCIGNTLLLGAVGQLQFEVVAAPPRDASTRSTRSTTRPTSPPRAGSRFPTRRRAAISSASRRASLATDVDGNPVFLATNKYNLQVTMERWPKVGFHATREHGQRLAHA